MNLGDLANLGEAIGGFAVIVSLLYLAVQIRINTKTVRASNYGDLLTMSAAFSSATLDPTTASLYVKGLADFEGLSAEDQVRFHGLMTLLFNATNRAQHLHQEKLLSDWMWDAHAHGVAALFENPGVKQWWKANHHWFTVEFREFAGGKLRDRGAVMESETGGAASPAG